MERLVAGTNSLNLYLRDTGRWGIFTFSGDEQPGNADLLTILEALKAATAGLNKPVAFQVVAVPYPNSRLLSAVIGLLTTADDLPRRLALVGASQTWLDMLDILGVRSAFLFFDDVEEITFED